MTFLIQTRHCDLRNALLLLFYCAGQRLTPHGTLEVRPGRIKLELKYDYDCERDNTHYCVC